MNLFIGIDLGTSGCRAIAINQQGKTLAQSTQINPAVSGQQEGFSEQDPQSWWQSVLQVLAEILEQIPADAVSAISVDGTSSTLLLCDEQGNPMSQALMYNDTRSRTQSELIARHAPPGNAAQGPSSSLAKLLYLQERYPDARYALHQADWITAKLSGQYGISDENNTLKLGYDPINRTWPDWLSSLPIHRRLLPQVVPPSTIIGEMDPVQARSLGLKPHVKIVAGTTDSTAAFIAAAGMDGQAVTSLGSTLVTKVRTSHPIHSTAYGVYSHKLFDQWLVGGASNSGGAVLASLFSVEEMQTMTSMIDPQTDTGYDFYPLLCPGERFPVADPQFQPRMPEHIPDNLSERAWVFQGLLEGLSRIETRAYHLLESLGAPYPDKVITAGGGSVNSAWTAIRQRYLKVPVITASHPEAAYGSALLARRGVTGQ